MNHKHGHSRKNGRRTPTYWSWAKMLERCRDPKRKYYGAKGVKVCERWLSFENFLADMGERPAGCSIDRINGAKGYEPDNCRWVTQSRQMRNTARTVWLEHDGRRMPMKDWAEATGIPYEILKSRIGKQGWSAERALTEPTHPRGGWQTWTNRQI